MKRILWIAALVLWIASLLLGVMAQATPITTKTPNKVLLVLTGEGRDGGKTRPGFEMGELAQAYLVLRENGLVVDIASPKGGAVEADQFKPDDDHIKPFLTDPDAQRLLSNTRRIQDIRAGEHQAIFIIGGKGVMFDLPNDAELQKLLGVHYDKGGILAAVCHGPAAFANVTLANGSLLVRGKRITGFTNEEETTFGKKWLKEFPWLLETRLRESGAVWEEAAMMMPKLVVDGRLITGQNPFSTTQTAEAIVRSLGLMPVKRKVYREEASMMLVERWLAGDKADVKRDLETSPAEYKPELIAMLGYYQSQAATNTASRQQALSVMMLGEPYMDHPQFKLGLAQAEAALGNISAARERLLKLLAAKPDNDAAKKLLATLPTQ